MQPCLVRTKTSSLAVRLFKVEDRSISLWLDSKGELVQKFTKDLNSVRASYEPLVLAEQSHATPSGVSSPDDFMVFPIRIKLPDK